MPNNDIILQAAFPAHAMSSTVAGPSAHKPLPIFEFTKRKRWADLLIKELADAIILILSPTRKILYCGTAVTELLGWKDEELIDGDLMDLINVNDQPLFQDSFDESIRTSCDLLSYVRLKSKYHFLGTEYHTPPKEIVFELTGYPHFVQDENGHSCKCVFAVAKPYPNRNTAMLNTFLELKTENERLQRQVIDLRASTTLVSMAIPAVPSNLDYSQATSSVPLRTHPDPMIVSSQRSAEEANAYYPGLGRGRYDDILPSSIHSLDGRRDLYGSLNLEEDGSEDTQRKKKLKKLHSSEQYVCVTCGRTDSPEWRKGPSGPKTLCNACGLRWAKQMRKIDDSADMSGELELELEGLS